MLSSEENSEHALRSSNIYWKEDTSHVAISLQPPWWQVHSTPSQDGGSWFWLHPWASIPKHLLGQAIVLFMDRRGAAKMWFTSHAVSGRFAFIFWKVAVSLQEVEEHGKRLSLVGLVEHVGLHCRSRQVRHVTCSQPAFLTWATSKVVYQEDISMAKTQTVGVHRSFWRAGRTQASRQPRRIYGAPSPRKGEWVAVLIFLRVKNRAENYIGGIL